VHLDRVIVEHFRNLTALQWAPHRHFNLLVGQNGQGKTNLLEAVAVLAGLRSFRTAKLAECVAFGAERATLSCRVVHKGVAVDLGVEFGKGARRLFVDGQPAGRAAAYLGRLVAVPFSTVDLHLPHTEPDDRRRWLDRAAFHHEPAHLDSVRDYDRALQQRNAALRSLRDGGDPQVLAAYDAVLAKHGAELMVRRAAVVERLRPVVQEVFGAIAAPGLQVDLRYQPRGVTADGVRDSATLERHLAGQLDERQMRDRALGWTTRGPHRDDVALQLDGRPASLHASQGQVRAFVLALKIAELRSLERAFSEAPLLLMDDVSSELDAERQAALLHHLDELGGQVLLTTTDARYLRIAAPRQVFFVQQGRIASGPESTRSAGSEGVVA
jgi:DNA replication and repair protein RecF